MKKAPTLFLKLVIFLFGIATLIGLIWFPQIEGRNVNAEVIDIYLKDPFLLYVYIGSIPFFLALYQGFRLISYIEDNKIFSKASIKRVRNIRYCALALIGFIATAIFYIALFGEEDGAGPVALGIYVIFATFVVVVTTLVFQKLLENGTDIKSENDLTV